LTAGEIKKIEYPQNPLKRTESEQTVDEQMDPPSFTRKLLKQDFQLSISKELEYSYKIPFLKMKMLINQILISHNNF